MNLISGVCLLQCLHVIVGAWICRVKRVGSSSTEWRTNIYFSIKSLNVRTLKQPKHGGETFVLNIRQIHTN